MFYNYYIFFVIVYYFIYEFFLSLFYCYFSYKISLNKLLTFIKIERFNNENKNVNTLYYNNYKIF